MKTSGGLSLLEVLISVSITLVLGAAIFHLYLNNESVFHDQNLISEMQQGARAAISQTADEIRMAGQGVPVYATAYDSGASEGAVAILAGSNATRINFRTSIAPADAAVVSPATPVFGVGSALNVIVDSATGLYTAVGGSPTGRYVYFWGIVDPSRAGWVRAAINTVTLSTRTIRATPSEVSPGGSLQFSGPPVMTLEEAVAVYYDSVSGTIKRTTATNMTSVTNPVWAPANELLPNVLSMRFEYYDKAGNIVVPDTTVNRATVAQVGIQLVVQTTADLSNRTRPTYGVVVRTRIRSAGMGEIR